MDNRVLAESIKEYVYIRQSLSDQPHNTALISRLAEICLLIGLYRSALRYSRQTYELSNNPAHLDTANQAEAWLKESCGRYCTVACGADNRVFVADRECNILSAYSGEGTVFWKMDREGIEDDALYRPDALAAAPDNSVYAASSILSRIQAFGHEGEFLRTFTVPKRFGTRVEIRSISCDPDGNLWVVDSLSRSMILLDSCGEELKRFTL